MKIIFFGTSRFSAHILESLQKDFDIAAVVTQPDKPVGRKQEIQQSAVAEVAEQLKLKVLKPTTLKNPEIEAELKQLNPDMFVVVAYGKIIPQNILDIPAKGALNIHGSLLPKYRGASPIQSAILDGEKETGITIMLMDAEMDHGPSLLSGKVAIEPNETFTEVETKLCELAQQLIKEALEKYPTGQLTVQPQNHDQATFTKIITKADGKIDWNKSASEIYNQYRAFSKWPGVWTSYEGKIFKLIKIQPSSKELSSEVETGTVIKNGDAYLVKAGAGYIELMEVQLEGKNNVSAKDFALGHKEFEGSKLV